MMLNDACYEFEDSNGLSSQLCTAMGHGISNSAISTCNTKLNNKSCSSCVVAPICTAFDDGNLVARAGFIIDCNNIREGYGKEIHQCGDNVVSINIYNTSTVSNGYHSTFHFKNSMLLYLFNLIACGIILLSMTIKIKMKKPKKIKNNKPKIQQQDAFSRLMEYFGGKKDDDELVDVVGDKCPITGDPRVDVTVYSPYDACQQDSNALRLCNDIENDNWEEINEILKPLRESGNIVALGYHHDIILREIEKKWKKYDNENKTEEFSQLLHNWYNSNDGEKNVDCRQLRAKAYIMWAWHIRNITVTNYGKNDGCVVFNTRIELARRELECAFELDPTDTLNIAPSVACAMACMETSHKVDSLLDILKNSNNPLHLKTHQCALQYHCGKWHGSNEDAIDYARSIMETLKDGDHLWILIVQAHFENYAALIERDQIRLRNATKKNEKIEEIPGVASKDYWENTDVRDEILHSYNQYLISQNILLATPEDRNIVHEARNLYAYCLEKIGESVLASFQCRMIGTYPTKFPWSHFGNPTEQYKDFCKMLQVKL